MRNPEPSGPTERRNNSFDFIRFVAAAAVLASHHFALDGQAEPGVPIFRDSLGGMAVCVFFAISGFLISQSLVRSNRADRFFAARLLRLFPNLLIALAITSLVMMLWFDNGSNWSAHVDYFANNVMMMILGIQYTISGVLEGRPIPGPNGSLWTLPYEFWLYVALFVCFRFRPSIRLGFVLGSAALFQTLWLLAEPGAAVPLLPMAFLAVALGKLGTFFFAGAIVAEFWPMLSRRRIAAVLAAACGLVFSRWAMPTENVLFALSFSTLLILFCSTNWLARFGRYGDPSYGIYIYAFPVQQLALIAVSDFYSSMAIALLITTLIGYATWHLFEKRCLGYREVFARILNPRA
jgi:peptidoglycan/LPS O-acetylase OafA/YrhL